MKSEKMPPSRQSYVWLVRIGMWVATGLTALLTLCIVGYVLLKGVPNLSWEFVSTKPSYLSEKIGILPDILNTLYIVIASLAVVLPLGVGAAIYLTEYASNRHLVGVIEYAAEALSGIPSIIKMSVTALEAVPKEYEDASLALGATPEETWFRVSAPAAQSGIAAAVVLGVGRAIGEAMAVMMVAGNAANMPGLFQSVRFLTTAVASEMSYSSGLQRQALFSIALVLFLFIMLINAILNFFLKGGKKE